MNTSERSPEANGAMCPHGSLSALECEKCYQEYQVREIIKYDSPIIIKNNSGEYERWTAVNMDNGQVIITKKQSKQATGAGRLVSVEDLLKWIEERRVERSKALHSEENPDYYSMFGVKIKRLEFEIDLVQKRADEIKARMAAGGLGEDEKRTLTEELAALKEHEEQLEYDKRMQEEYWASTD